jgi:hypothetical protein
VITKKKRTSMNTSMNTSTSTTITIMDMGMITKRSQRRRIVDTIMVMVMTTTRK